MTAKHIEVYILGQSYRLSCRPENEAALRQAVARVDSEMNRARDNNRVRGTDRIAVMAAITLASELGNLRRSIDHGDALPADEIRRSVQLLNDRIGRALDDAN
ncbi:cell division protein ZapA [Chitinasiproducens palmae]|uniref:Cell division protein ZapA n=1 Tax=Chitinasiproducens palmae TaxID=1770053 RepID=A0A1H2PMZ3_9BURK|nr:cell division protein ZapA [Chitinasiproducens palmae]SDV48011.1 cell division protein ZapA [Chitinasiproducens palmae]